MKKVLSVLLAAAMVMGMGVSSMARNKVTVSTDTYYGSTAAAVDFYPNAANITWQNLMVVRNNAIKYNVEKGYNTSVKLEAGDELWFTFSVAGVADADNLAYNGKLAFAPSHWKVKASNSDIVKSAEVAVIDGTATGANTAVNNWLWALCGGEDNVHAKNTANDSHGAKTFDHLADGELACGVPMWKEGVVVGGKEAAVKVVLESDFDYYVEEDEDIFFYIYDTKNSSESSYVEVDYAFSDYATSTLVEDDLDYVLTVKNPTTYTYAKGEKAAYATVDFNSYALASFKMYSEEKYTLGVSAKYNSVLSKAYDTDVEVITFTMKGVDSSIDLLFPAKSDKYQVVAVVDGELVPVEATYVENHKFNAGKATNGYLVEDAEYTQYALIDADVEIAVEEVETEVEAPVVEAEKANPETGAADFVGAAVAMAVVSVAAAGALALKK